MNNINFSKKMPTTIQNSGDRNLNFALGRQYYIRVSNNNNIDYSKCLKESSNICGKPIKQNDSSLRIQQLRLKNVGSGSMNLKNQHDKLNYFGSNDYNYVNSRLSRARAGGSIAPKKSNIYINK
tara:strand:+ start:905 stop:1276 length:372 start_codon:yes stop_codon:yes gene_type:complete